MAKKRQEPSPELLEILACPSCKGKLDHRKAESRLVCAKCGSYPVEDGIPALMAKGSA